MSSPLLLKRGGGRISTSDEYGDVILGDPIMYGPSRGAYGGGVFMVPCATGSDPNLTNPYVTSSDGLHWSSVNNIPGTHLHGTNIYYFNNKFVAVVKKNIDISLSLLGVSIYDSGKWSSIYLVGDRLVGEMSVYNFNNQYIAISREFISTSTDLMNWTTPRLIYQNYEWRDFTYFNGYYYCSGYINNSTSPLTVVRSANLFDWVVVANFPREHYALRFACGNGIIFLAGYAEYYTSIDGLNWSEKKQIDGANYFSLPIFHNGNFYIGGKDCYAFSSDCITWKIKKIPSNEPAQSVQYICIFGDDRIVFTPSGGPNKRSAVALKK